MFGVLGSVHLIHDDLLMSGAQPPDVSVAVMGQQVAAAAATEFLSQWREGRERITENLYQLHQQGRAAVEALVTTDDAVQTAAIS